MDAFTSYNHLDPEIRCQLQKKRQGLEPYLRRLLVAELERAENLWVKNVQEIFILTT